VGHGEEPFGAPGTVGRTASLPRRSPREEFWDAPGTTGGLVHCDVSHNRLSTVPEVGPPDHPIRNRLR
jgi:hypothetical protein